jgi:hypothetical protein
MTKTIFMFFMGRVIFNTCRIYANFDKLQIKIIKEISAYSRLISDPASSAANTPTPPGYPIDDVTFLLS